MFSGFSYPSRLVAMINGQQEETGSGTSKMTASKLEILIS